MLDSAGVTVVANYRSDWGEGEEWSLSPEPLAVFPVTDAGGPLVGAILLDDGRVVVADAATVRFLGTDGSVVSVDLGTSPAAVPLQAISSISRLPGDSVLVFDAVSGVVRVLAPDGGIARWTNLVWDGDVPLARAHAFEDGTLLVRTGWRASTAARAGTGAARAGTGSIRAPLPFVRFASNGTSPDTVAVVPGDPVVTVALGSAMTFTSPILGAHTVSGVSGDVLYVGTGESYRLTAYSKDGEVLRIVTLPEADLTVSEEEIEAVRRERANPALQRASPVVQRLLAQIDEAVPVPATRPAYSALVADRVGNVWVAEYPWMGPAPGRTPTRWHVFNPQGRLLGEVGVPEGLEITDIGEDHVLGFRVSDNVAVVESYLLSRDPG